MNENVFLTMKQAMERYQVSRTTMYKIAREADAMFKLCGSVRIDALKVDEFIRNNKR